MLDLQWRLVDDLCHLSSTGSRVSMENITLFFFFFNTLKSKEEAQVPVLALKVLLCSVTDWRWWNEAVSHMNDTFFSLVITPSPLAIERLLLGYSPDVIEDNLFTLVKTCILLGLITDLWLCYCHHKDRTRTKTSDWECVFHSLLTLQQELFMCHVWHTFAPFTLWFKMYLCFLDVLTPAWRD